MSSSPICAPIVGSDSRIVWYVKLIKSKNADITYFTSCGILDAFETLDVDELETLDEDLSWTLDSLETLGLCASITEAHVKSEELSK